MNRLRNVLLGTCCLVFFFSFNATAQSLEELSVNIRSSVESEKTTEAIAQLRSLKQKDPAAFKANSFDYLLGRLLERKGDRPSAVANYSGVVNGGSSLAQYGLWHLAQIARSSGDLVQEREYLRRLTASFPSSLLREAATYRLAQSFNESKDYASAIAVLKPLTESSKTQVARSAQALIGGAYVRTGKTDEARAVYNKLLTSMPDSSRPDDFALLAVRGLDSLEKNSAASLSEGDHLTRASIYQFNRDFDGARDHYLAVVNQFPQSSSVTESLFQIGRGLYQQARYDEALKHLQRASNSSELSSSVRDAMGLIAGAYVRLKRFPEAVNVYKQYIERFPNGPNPERAYLNLIDVLRDSGRDDEALTWIKQTREHFKDQQASALALFSQARIHLAQNSWAAALADLDELLQQKDLGGLRISGGTTSGEVTFLRAFALEELGRYDEAIEAYLSIPDGRNEYYGFRANQRLSAIAGDASHASVRAKVEAGRSEAARLFDLGQTEAARRAVQTQLRVEYDPAKRQELLKLAARIYAALPSYTFPSYQLLKLGRTEARTAASVETESTPSHQLLADELLFLGLYDEGAPELAAAKADLAKASAQNQQPVTAPATDQAFSEAVYFERAGMPYQAIRFAESAWRSIPADYLIELAPPQMARMLYPAPYRASLLKHATTRQLDPLFVLSIARQETRFQADAKSVAAARGLMQFISATAESTAKALGRRNFDQDELYNPDTALQFGAQYLSSLFSEFPNQPDAVAAAYNGGPDNIARWMARAHSQEPTRYVPEIGFSQSKDYVFRVMSNYWTYKKLYDQSLTPLNQNQ